MITSLTPSVLERAEGMMERVRDRLPTLTTGILIVAFLVCGAAGEWVSRPFHKAKVNAEWRERIASKSATVRHVIAKGDAEAEALDAEIINTLGDHDAQLQFALRRLEDVSRAPATPGECRIPADSLRE